MFSLTREDEIPHRCLLPEASPARPQWRPRQSTSPPSHCARLLRVFCVLSVLMLGDQSGSSTDARSPRPGQQMFASVSAAGSASPSLSAAANSSSPARSPCTHRGLSPLPHSRSTDPQSPSPRPAATSPTPRSAGLFSSAGAAVGLQASTPSCPPGTGQLFLSVPASGNREPRLPPTLPVFYVMWLCV